MSSKEKQRVPTLLTIKRRLHGVRRAFFLTLALIVAVAAYFNLVGLPQWAVRKLEQSLADHNLYVSVENIKLDFYYGFDAQKVIFYKTELKKEPLFHAANVAGYISVESLFRDRHLLAHLHVRDGQGSTALLPPEMCDFFPPPVVDELDAEWRDGKVILSKGAIRWGKLLIRTSGDIFYDQDGVQRVSATEEPLFLDKVRLGSQWVHDSLVLQDPSELELDFSLNTILPERSSLSLKLDAGRTLLRGVLFSDLDLALSLTPEQLSLHLFELKHGAGFLKASGAVGLSNYHTALKVNNTLDLNDLALMFSPEWTRTLSDQQVDIPEGFQLTLQSDANDGLFYQDLSGTLFAKTLSVRGVPFNNIYTSFKYADGVLDWPRLRAHVPTETIASNGNYRQVTGGEIFAAGQYNLHTSEYSVRSTLGFDPWLLLPLVAKTPFESIVRNHEFYDEVELSVSAKGRFGDPGSHSLSGHVNSGSASRKGAYVDSARGDFAYQNSLLTLQALHVEKDGDQSDGVVMVNFRTKIIDVEYEGGIDPKIIAQMIHPVVVKPLSYFEFNGDNYVKCRGSVDYGHGLKNHLTGTYSGSTLRSPVADVDQVRFDFGMVGTQLYFTNINAQVFGGHIDGNSKFTLYDKNSNSYTADLNVNAIDMTQLARFYGESSTENPLGVLSGHAHLEGEMGAPVGTNIRGSGSARLEGGLLVELPVFEKFTQVARVVFSQFRSFSQTDCSMDFKIRDGAVHSDNFLLAGDMMTLKGQGRYDFASGFDAEVEMKPFRQNMLTRVVQWATIPFSELFKFSVQGPLSNPTWRLSRFPDMSSMFKRNIDDSTAGEEE